MNWFNQLILNTLIRAAYSNFAYNNNNNNNNNKKKLFQFANLKNIKFNIFIRKSYLMLWMGYDNGEETNNKLMQRITTKTEYNNGRSKTHNIWDI